MTESSLNYIIAVLTHKWTEEPVDWYEALGFLVSHRIAGLFYSCIKSNGLALPLKAENILKKEYRKQERKTQFLRGQIEELSAALMKADAQCVFLKGSLLSNLSVTDEVYADGDRASNDIDLLVSTESMTKVEEALKALGYIQGYYDNGRVVPFSRKEILTRRLNRGETAPFVKLSQHGEYPYAEVDINFSLGNIPGGYENLIKEMLRRKKLYQGKVALPVSDNVLFFMQLLLHQYKESELMFTVERGKDIDLYKLVDIYYLWSRDFFDKEELKKLADQFGVKKEVGAVLGQTARIFEDELLLSVAKEYGDEQPMIVDYKQKRYYRWTASERERLLAFDSRIYLKEAGANR